MAGTGRRTWYHTIDLPDGSCTPGWFDTRAAPAHVCWPPSVDGARALDVGTFDGFWAFELERRGAAVTALDVDDPAALDWTYDDRARGPELVRSWGSERGPGFETARAMLGSGVERVACSVYDLDPAVHGSFDVLVCGSLLLHLRDPVLALERMRAVCAPGGSLVLVEALDPALELAAMRVPSARLAPDWDQWWRANSPGLVRLVELAGFEVVDVGPRFLQPFGPGGPRLAWRRTALHALAARRPRERGFLMRSLRAVPRPPRPTR
jgi:tRNA (mo5U34)-methyltransferase